MIEEFLESFFSALTKLIISAILICLTPLFFIIFIILWIYEAIKSLKEKKKTAQQTERSET